MTELLANQSAGDTAADRLFAVLFVVLIGFIPTTSTIR